MLKILSHSDIKEVELATMQHENITSLQLMERASNAISTILQALYPPCNVYICVGKGGNGGDGLATARLLNERGYKISILTLFNSKNCGEDYRKNLARIPKEISITNNVDQFFADIQHEGVVIDAIFGVGYQRREPNEIVNKTIRYINKLNRDHLSVVAIDIPSAMESTSNTTVNENNCVRCDKTLTIYSPKLPMLLPTSGEYAGEIITIDIGYSKSAIDKIATKLYYTDTIKEPQRPKFSHKGNFGSILIVGAGVGMFGASIIAAKGAEVAGAGLIRVVTPKKLLASLYSNIPAATSEVIEGDFWSKQIDKIERFSTIVVGMGMGRDQKTITAFRQLICDCKERNIPMVIDADGINIVSQNSELLNNIPSGSILTPHIGEFRRLVGEYSSESEKLEKLSSLSTKYNITVLLKGAHTVVSTPIGQLYFNSTGCNALARGGAGDLLSGIIGAYLSTGINSTEAAIIGVFNHGAAGDKSNKLYGAARSTIDRIVNSF